MYVDGEEVSGLKGKALRNLRRKVGMIFQNYNLVYSLSVLQNVLHGCLGYMGGLKGIFGRYSEEDKERAVELLKELGMEQFCLNRAADLSGGQKQRVGIARAIMQNPKLLLCDEPTGALDYVTGKQILQLLQDTCRRDGITVIIVTHNAALADMADRLIRFKSGRVTDMTVNPDPRPIAEIEW